MATHRVEPSLARLFQLGIDAELPKKLTEWKETLDKGEITDEMVRVFHGVGWLSSLRDPRIMRDEAKPGAVTKPARGVVDVSPGSRH